MSGAWSGTRHSGRAILPLLVPLQNRMPSGRVCRPLRGTASVYAQRASMPTRGPTVPECTALHRGEAGHQQPAIDLARCSTPRGLLRRVCGQCSSRRRAESVGVDFQTASLPSHLAGPAGAISS